jgi:cobalt-zinc-cadmium efflux system protein
MSAVDGVEEIQDLHVWAVTPGFPALDAHVFVGLEEYWHLRRRELEELLEDEYGIAHNTLQVDHVGDHEAGQENPRFHSDNGAG